MNKYCVINFINLPRHHGVFDKLRLTDVVGQTEPRFNIYLNPCTEQYKSHVHVKSETRSVIG